MSDCGGARNEYDSEKGSEKLVMMLEASPSALEPPDVGNLYITGTPKTVAHGPRQAQNSQGDVLYRRVQCRKVRMPLYRRSVEVFSISGWRSDRCRGRHYIVGQSSHDNGDVPIVEISYTGRT